MIVPLRGAAPVSNADAAAHGVCDCMQWRVHKTWQRAILQLDAFAYHVTLTNAGFQAEQYSRCHVSGCAAVHCRSGTSGGTGTRQTSRGTYVPQHVHRIRARRMPGTGCGDALYLSRHNPVHSQATRPKPLPPPAGRIGTTPQANGPRRHAEGQDRSWRRPAATSHGMPGNPAPRATPLRCRPPPAPPLLPPPPEPLPPPQPLRALLPRWPAPARVLMPVGAGVNSAATHSRWRYAERHINHTGWCDVLMASPATAHTTPRMKSSIRCCHGGLSH